MKEYIFGLFPCLCALRAGRRKIYKLMIKEGVGKTHSKQKFGKVDEILSLANEKNVSISHMAKGYLDRLIGNRPHQNIIMKVSTLSYMSLSVQEMTREQENNQKSSQLWLALDQIQDPMNLGAILRSAGYFGIDGIIVSKRNSCRLSPVVSKASSGTMEWMNIYSSGDLAMDLKQLARSGWDVIGSTMHDENSSMHTSVKNCDEILLEKPSILVLGNEGMGVREEILSSCTKFITVPSFSNSVLQDLDSLNVSVATGILIYNLVSKRLQLTKQ